MNITQSNTMKLAPPGSGNEGREGANATSVNKDRVALTPRAESKMEKAYSIRYASRRVYE
jgi:hypothetical protein